MPDAPSVLFATPCYGGMVTEAYLRSFLVLSEALRSGGLEYDLMTLTNESHVVRARNTCAATFMAGAWSHLMFIDADIQFSVEDFSRVWNIEKPLAVGVYPMKRPGAGYSAWVGGKLVGDLDQFPGPIAVDYAGTGFMLIAREVFEAIDAPEYEEGHVGHCRRWFHSDVVDDGPGPFYCSEDYWFCREARAAGYDIWMDPGVRLVHWGTAGYGLGEHRKRAAA